VSAFRLADTPAKTQSLIESGWRLVLGSQPKSVKHAASGSDYLPDQPPADPAAAVRSGHIEVTDTADSLLSTIRVNIHAAHTDRSAANIGYEQRLSGTIEPVDSAVPLFDQATEESMSDQLAFGDQLSEAIERQHLKPKNVCGHPIFTVG